MIKKPPLKFYSEWDSYKGENLGSKEATECFFAITKLFQCNDPVLRRMVYLGIKSLAKVSEDVIIVTSSLTKDMSGKEERYICAKKCILLY